MRSMTNSGISARCIRRHCVLAALTLVLLAGAGVARADDCEMPWSVIALARLSETMARRETLDAREQDMLITAARQVDVHMVLRRMKALGLGSRAADVTHLVTTARAAAAGQAPPSALSAPANNVRNVMYLACGDDAQHAGVGLRARTPTELGRLSGLGSGPGAGEPRGVLGVSLVLGVLGGAIGLLLLGRLVCRWGFSLRYHRRSCLIPGALEIGGESIPGRIIIAGRRGARFQPADHAASTLLAKLALAGRTQLVAEDFRRDAYIDSIQQKFAVVLFHESLPRAALKALLEKSKVKPDFTSERTPPSNIRRPRSAAH